jgi:hypothetical protein
LWQPIPVKPSSHYEVTAFVKSQELQSSAGPRFIVQDSAARAILARGEENTGTTGWREERFDFDTTPSTRMVFLRLARDEGRLIHGRMWVDDVSVLQH